MRSAHTAYLSVFHDSQKKWWLLISLTHINRMTLVMWTLGVFCEAGSEFLGAFVKLQKATISFVMWVCLSVCLEQPGNHWTDFNEISYLGIFRKCVEKIQFSLKSDKNNGYFTWIPMYIYDNISH
jgi:hypothetical protein